MVKLTHTQLVDILAESWTMRSIVAGLVIGHSPTIISAVEEIVRGNQYNKIAAIKMVRETLDANDIYPAFNLDWNHSGHGTLGLADCKRLVEHVGAYLGIDFQVRI